jgi:hypothetical protein
VPAAGLVITASVGLWAAGKLGAAAPLPVRRSAAIERYVRELRGSAPDTSYGLNDPVSRRAIRTPSWTTGIGCAALVLKTGRQRRAAAERAAHRSQRRQDREGSRYPCRARSGGFAGHSLRSGFLTSAAARRASIFKMADQSRHRSMDTPRATFATPRFSSLTPARACCKRSSGA